MHELSSWTGTFHNATRSIAWQYNITWLILFNRKFQKLFTKLFLLSKWICFLVSVRQDDLQTEYSFLVREERQLQQVETFPVRPWEGMVFEAPSQAN